MDDDVKKLALYFSSRGATEERALFMARQMLKRAEQLAVEKSVSKEEALLGLMKRFVEAQNGH